ncbi:hypothetical protein AX774_g7728, partial [Zancudomyces culisetae]
PAPPPYKPEGPPKPAPAYTPGNVAGNGGAMPTPPSYTPNGPAQGGIPPVLPPNFNQNSSQFTSYQDCFAKNGFNEFKAADGCNVCRCGVSGAICTSNSC